PGENLVQPRGYGVQGVEYPVRAHRRGYLLGPVVPGNRALHGFDGRGAVVVPDGDRFRAAAGGACELTGPLAADSAGTCRSESHAVDCFESLRPREVVPGSGRVIHPVLWFVIHR